MRCISLLIAGSVVASCTNAPPPSAEARTPSQQSNYDRAVGGKVAGKPMDCLPTYQQNDMSVIDGRTVAFRVGQGTAYLVHFTPGCELLDAGHYALLSRQFGSAQLCRGDIQQVVDIMNRTTVGSCSVADIVPYKKP